MTEQDLLFEKESLDLNLPQRITDKPDKLDKPVGGSQLKRSTPVTQRKVPPPRPPPISPDKQKRPSFPPGKPPLPSGKTLPNRPPPPSNLNSNLIDISSSSDNTGDAEMFFDTTCDKQNEAFLELASGENTTMIEDDTKKRPILLPESPFYTPSSDLLDLDQSLFTETMKSLSEESRSLINSRSPTPSTNPFKASADPIEETKTQQQPFDAVFNESTTEEDKLHRSPVLSRPVRKTVSGTASPVDPFASCFEDAKKDFQLTNKR